MTKLAQMVYISRASMPMGSQNGQIGPEISKILRKSRINNRAKNIVGALYFGNGYFFQCLEGEEGALKELYETLKQDPRHTDLKIISLKPITQCSFGEWEMKYLPAEQEVKKLLSSMGEKTFDPYRFNEALTEKMLSLLVNGANQTLPEQEDTDGACRCRGWQLISLILAIVLCADIAWRVLS